MSNNAVGNVFALVIDKVIKESHNDFEESGIDQHTLNELREAWQKRLSEFRIAQFPWDPAPAPLANPPTLPSNVTKKEEGSPSPAPPPPAPSSTANYGGVRIKPDPDFEPGGSAYASTNGFTTSNMNPQMAQQRAANLLQQQYGSSASASIGALQQQAGLSFPGQQKGPGLQLPQPKQESQQEPRSPLANAQTDGAAPSYDDDDDDVKDFMKNNPSLVDSGPLAYDRMLRRQIEQVSRQMDSGLLIPPDEKWGRKAGKRKASKVKNTASSSRRNGSAAPGELGTISQMDGEIDYDEERDEDAINSDLDDSEDELAKGDDDDDEFGETMLCLYDKVQRVKNKWKCTLKDGLLTTNGKEYVFHKAQGEFEW